MQEEFEVKYKNIKDWDSLKKLTWESIECGIDVLYEDRLSKALISGKVLFNHGTKSICVIDWEDGNTYEYTKEFTFEGYRFYIKPLFILEGKSVYKGDVLWNSSEECTDLMYIASYIDSGLLYSEHNHTGAYCEYIHKLTWNKPAETKETLQDNPKFKVGDKVKHLGRYTGDVGVVTEVEPDRILVQWSYTFPAWHKGEYLIKVQEDKPEVQKNVLELNLGIKPKVHDDLIKALSNMHNSLGYVLEVLEKYKK